MNIAFAKDGMPLFMLASLSEAGIVTGSAAAAPDREPASPGLFARMAGAVKWLRELPRRNEIVEELSLLSDRELADIGLDRTELARVFDRQFAAERNCLRG